MKLFQSILGIVSIIFSTLFFIFLHLFYTNERFGQIFAQTFPFFPILVIQFIPMVAFGSAIIGLRLKNRNKIFPILGAIVSTPVMLVSIAANVVYIIYLTRF